MLSKRVWVRVINQSNETMGVKPGCMWFWAWTHSLLQLPLSTHQPHPPLSKKLRNLHPKKQVFSNVMLSKMVRMRVISIDVDIHPTLTPVTFL